MSLARSFRKTSCWWYGTTAVVVLPMSSGLHTSGCTTPLFVLQMTISPVCFSMLKEFFPKRAFTGASFEDDLQSGKLDVASL